MYVCLISAVRKNACRVKDYTSIESHNIDAKFIISSVRDGVKQFYSIKIKYHNISKHSILLI